MDWGQTISQEHNCCYLLWDPNKYWNHFNYLKCCFSGKKSRLILKHCELFLSLFLIQAHHFTPGYAFFGVNCWNQNVGVAGLGWLLKFKAVKEHQQAQILEVTLQCWGTLEWHFSWRWNFIFCIYITSKGGETKRNICCVCHPCPVSPEHPGCCVGEWGSPFHMTTLLVADCGGENLQLPVPVLKSAFVLPAYFQGNQGHLEMFL